MIKQLLYIAVLLSVASLMARADATWAFAFTADPVGCVATGSCDLPSLGGGTFTTGDLALNRDYGVGFPVAPILAISGTFNGFNMILGPPDGQPGAIQTEQGITKLFDWAPIVFFAGGEQWELFRQDGPCPIGTNNLLLNPTGTVQAVSLQIVSVPEPSEVALGMAAMLCGLLLKLKNQRRSKSCPNAREFSVAC